MLSLPNPNILANVSYFFVKNTMPQALKWQVSSSQTVWGVCAICLLCSKVSIHTFISAMPKTHPQVGVVLYHDYIQQTLPISMFARAPLPHKFNCNASFSLFAIFILHVKLCSKCASMITFTTYPSQNDKW